MDNNETACACHCVKQRVIYAAEELFAKNGYEKTSVRDITTKAECNVASINYYFGGKENLYHEVFKQHLVDLRQMRIDAIDEMVSQKGDDISVEDIVRTCVAAFFRPFEDSKTSKIRMMLLWREVVDPHLPDEVFYKEVIEPVANTFANIFIKVCSELTKERAYFIFESIVGQLGHLIVSQHTKTVSKGKLYDHFNSKAYIEHVIEFSTAGVLYLTQKEKLNAE